MITLAWPIDSQTSIVRMRDPEFQDQEVFGIHTQFATMLDGSLRGRKQTPITTKLSWRFTSLTRNKVLQLRTFISLASGSKVRLIDFNGITWVGYLIAQPFDILTNSRGQGTTEYWKESNEISFDFEGTKL